MQSRPSLDHPAPARLLAPALLALLAAASPVCGAFDPDNPPPGLFDEQWAEVYIGGAKVGYAHTTMVRAADAVTVREVCQLRMDRAGQPITMRLEQESREAVTGGVQAFRSAMDLARLRSSQEGLVATGTLTVTTTQLDLRQTQVFAAPTGALMAWGLYRESLRRGLSPGTTYTIASYVPELRLDGPVSTRVRVGDLEPVIHGGRTNLGARVEQTTTVPAGQLELLQWVDANGRTLKACVPAPGLGDLVMLASDQRRALLDFVPPELFTSTTIPAGRAIARDRANRITYRLSYKPGKSPPQPLNLPQTDAQRLTRQPDGSLHVVVTRQRHLPTPTATAATPAPPSAEYLTGNLMMNLADPDLIALAGRAADGERDPYRLADRLRRAVSAYVTRKDLDIGFGTANEVCRTRQGDCSEHAVLLAALGRLQGLPSRVVAGLAYTPLFGGQSDIFGYHLWTQFLIDDRWIDVDAALDETVCSPTRIAFAVSSLHNTGAVDISLPLLDKMGALELLVLEVVE